jgi:sugar transferase (PEP-CTERM/EpsH1 system associated)
MRVAGRPRRIVHIVYSFAIGGLENVIVQLINRLPVGEFEHVLISLTNISDFKNRIQRSDVQFIELHKPPGHAFALYPRIYRLLRQLKPDVVHSCNLAALEIAPLAWLARVPLRVHAEHGWDAHDPHGANPRYRLVRKLYKPFVSQYIAVSQEIDTYLTQAIGVIPGRHSLIANGVDTEVFAPPTGMPSAAAGCPFAPGLHWIVGTVGRLQTVKNQPLLARAFVRVIQEHPKAAERMRLIIVGEGPLRAAVEDTLAEAGLQHLAWLAGARNDVADIMRGMNCFVLPSQAEGTSCTLQEAMSCGLPVVATSVGGTPDLVAHGLTGFLVPPDDVESMAEAIWRCFNQTEQMRLFGQTARSRAMTHFGLAGMVQRYQRLFSI